VTRAELEALADNLQALIAHFQVVGAVVILTAPLPEGGKTGFTFRSNLTHDSQIASLLETLRKISGPVE
jgi:hypothetical protein